MLIVTDAPMSLLVHHVEMCRYEGMYPGVLEINKVEEGGYLDPVVRILQVNSIPEDNLPPYLTLFVSCNNSKKHPNYIAISPELYKGPLDRLQAIFTREAKEDLWQKYKYNPRRLSAELYTRIIQYKINPKPITLDEPNKSASYVSLLGTIRGTQYLASLSNSELFHLLIGTPISWLHSSLMNNPTDKNLHILHYLSHMRDDFLVGGVDLRTLAIAFNEGLRLHKDNYV